MNDMSDYIIDESDVADPLEMPRIEPGAMEGLKPFVAKPEHQQPLGFPGELVDNWQEKAIDKMGELLTKYRSLQVYLDSCVKCGACTDSSAMSRRAWPSLRSAETAADASMTITGEYPTQYRSRPELSQLRQVSKVARKNARTLPARVRGSPDTISTYRARRSSSSRSKGQSRNLET